MTEAMNATQPMDSPDLQARVRAEIDKDGLSLTGLSQLTGIGKARLSQWLNGKYSGNNQAIEQDIERWLESRSAAAELHGQLPAAPEWVETSSARAVLGALGFAQMAEAVCVVYGGAGVGKTTTINHYRKQSPNVWVVTATPACASTGALLKRVAQALGMRTTGTVDALESSIVERVRESQGLLVIDEAQHLTHRALDSVRSIHDAAGVGLALVGNEVVYAQLTGGNRAVGFAQLFSRVAKRVRLARAKQEDVLAILDAWGIRHKEARQYCLTMGRRPGALRGLSQTLRLASMFATNAGDGQPELGHIRDAWADLGGES